MSKPGERGIKRILSATRYSWNGLKVCWRKEAAFRQELLSCIILLPLAFWLGETGVEKALLAGTCMLVLIVEVLNSSIEAVVDRIGHEHHDLSGLAKDLGSAAVLLSIILLVLVWALLLFSA